MKVPLTTQTKFVNAVISIKDIKTADFINDELIKWCNSSCDLYCFIFHDKDVNENGEKKLLHIHLCALLKSNKKRLSTTLNEIASSIGVNPLAISIEKMNDVNGSIQYLIHKNDKNKYQYEVNEIVSNLSKDELSVYLSSENGQLSIDRLLDIIWSCQFRRIEIMKTIGLGYYHLYRNVINDIIKEYQGL